MTDPHPDLSGTEWLERARPMLAVLDAENGATRVVGGAVRDTLLGIARPVEDIDMATLLLPEEVMARARTAGFSVYPTGVDHGTITVVDGTVRAEVTTLRADIATDGRHAKVRFGTDWAEDAARRDFTMNALYCDAAGALFDPLGDGMADCLARRVRFVGEPDRRIAEDRLRVLRYFRFCATHGEQQTEAAALAACARAADKLEALSGERIGQEMLKLLAAPKIASTLKGMEEAGLFSALALPDVGLDDLDVLDQLAFDPGVPARLALLAGDSAGIGEVAKRWRLSNAMADEAREVWARLALAGAKYWNRLRYRAGDDALAIAWLARGLGLVSSEEWGVITMQLRKGNPGPLPVTGADLIAHGIAPGPQLGQALDDLLSDWIGSGFTLDREALLARLNP